MRDQSLNGGETRPLTKHTRGKLEEIARQPIACNSLNAGVLDRLTREPYPLCKRVSLPSPYKKDRGASVPHLQITDAGRAELGLLKRCSGLVMPMGGGLSMPCRLQVDHDGPCSEVARRRRR